jgi:hypothetical protein
LLHTTKMLASTVQFSKNGRPQKPQPAHSQPDPLTRTEEANNRPFRTQQRAPAKPHHHAFHTHQPADSTNTTTKPNPLANAPPSARPAPKHTLEKQARTGTKPCQKAP